MPKDVSSSSGDEGDSPATPSPSKRKDPGEKATRYQCPADFVSFCHKPCSSTLTKSLSSKKNELWLIKAPASFNPECFSGIKVPLSGLQTFKVPSAAGVAKGGSVQQIYSILASSHSTSEFRLLTSDKQSSDAVNFAPTFSGLLNVCENYGGSGANLAPQVISTAAAPSIPPGLKQRFHPFGCKTPTQSSVAESQVDGAAFGPSSATPRPPAAKRLMKEAEHEDGKNKKKKKNKEKRIKTEQGEAVTVKEEPVAQIQDDVMVDLPLQQGDVLEEKRKKKKKKKDREREEVEEALEPSVTVKVEEIAVKCEPMDASYDDVAEASGKKKKKKKKKSKTADD